MIIDGGDDDVDDVDDVDDDADDDVDDDVDEVDSDVKPRWIQVDSGGFRWIRMFLMQKIITLA